MAEAEGVVKKFALSSMGVGLVPLPSVDMALLATIQLGMLRSLARLYQVDFVKARSRSIIGALVGGSTSVILSNNIAYAVLKKVAIPVAAASIVTGSVFSASSTYALGRVFIEHFESGGTFLSFDPDRAKDDYAQHLDKGRRDLKSFVGVKP